MVSVSDLNGSPTTPNAPSKTTSDPSRSDARQGVRQPQGFPGLPPGWISEWETFPGNPAVTGKAPLNLFAATHRRDPWSGPRALVVLHGMGEHGGRYLHLPHHLQSQFDLVFCVDHRGHGRSEGLRGHLERFDLLADDAALAIRRLEASLVKRFGRAEIHLLGHSLGGHVALRTLLLHPDLPIHSASVSAPFLAIKVKVPAVKKFAAIALSRIWGSLQLATELDPGSLSHDKAVVEAYASDRLVHNKMTPHFFTELTAAMADTRRRHSGINPPIQVLVPLQDPLVDPEAALEFFRELKHRDKRLKTYPGFFHEPMNEVGKEQVFEDIASWVAAHRPEVA